MTDIGGAFEGKDGLAPGGIKKRVFVSDVDGTLIDQGVRKDYFRALVKMHLAGHIVPILSGRENAEQDVQNSPVVEEVFKGLRLSPDDRNKIRETLLAVGDKAPGGLKAAMLAKGVPQDKVLKPDVFCDDDRPQCLPVVHLDPNSDQFEAFVALAKNDPNGALDMLLEGGASVHELNSCAKMQQEVQDTFDALLDFQSEFPQEFDFIAQNLGGLEEILLSDEVVRFLQDSVLSDNDVVTELFFAVLEDAYQGPSLPLKDPFRPHEMQVFFDL